MTFPGSLRQRDLTHRLQRIAGIFLQPDKMAGGWERRESDEYAENSGRDGAFEGAVSRGARDGNFVQGMAAGSGASNADEQSRSGGRRKAGRSGGIRRHRKSGAQLGMFSCDCEIAARTGE